MPIDQKWYFIIKSIYFQTDFNKPITKISQHGTITSIPPFMKHLKEIRQFICSFLRNENSSEKDRVGLMKIRFSNKIMGYNSRY